MEVHPCTTPQSIVDAYHLFSAFAPKITEAVKAKSADNAKIFKKACAAGAKATSPTSNASSTTSATLEDDPKEDRRKRAAGGRGRLVGILCG